MTTSLFFVAISTTSNSFAREFVIAGTPQLLFKMEAEGKYQGIDIEILQQVMKELKLPYKIKLIKSDKRILQEAKMGKVDMLISYSKKSSRLAYLDYPQVSYKQINWNFFIRKSDENNIHFNSFDDLKELKVGATSGVSYTKAFWEAGLNLNTVSKNDLQITKLLNHRIDIVPMNTLNTLYEAQQLGYREQISYLSPALKSRPYYNPFPKASTYPNKAIIMQRYDEAIQKLQADGTIQAIFDKYLSN